MLGLAPGQISLAVALATIAPGASLELAAASAISSPQRLMGCWGQTSPYRAIQIPADKNEWGTRTWCFRRRGLLETFNMACGRTSGLDGWDGQSHCRWRWSRLELEDCRCAFRCRLTQVMNSCLREF